MNKMQCNAPRNCNNRTWIVRQMAYDDDNTLHTEQSRAASDQSSEQARAEQIEQSSDERAYLV